MTSRRGRFSVTEWFRRWQRARRRAAKKRNKASRRRERFGDWDSTSRYGDPSDGA